MIQTSYLIFVQCSLGLEEVVARELAQWGLTGRVLAGGVELRAGWAELVRCGLMSRSAESVRVRLKAFVARDFEQLVDQLKKLPFRAHLGPGTPVEVRVSCHHSRLWHSDAVAERVYSVLTEHVGCARGEANGQVTMQPVFVRVDHDEVQISLDAGGPRMHRRGYRMHVERASLRETLAYPVVEQLLGELGDATTIWDPFCGAGTLLLELLHWRAGRLPGERRSLSLETWRGHSEAQFAELKQGFAVEAAQAAQRRFPQVLSVIGSDRSRASLDAATKNATGAELGPVEWRLGDILDVATHIPAQTAIVCNPPYGKRLADCDGVKKLVQLTQLRPDLGPVVVLTGGEAKQIIPSKWPATLRFLNGGLQVSVRVKRRAT